MIAAEIVPASARQVVGNVARTGHGTPRPGRHRRRSRGARFGALITATVVLFAVLGPMLISADPDQQNLSARFEPPFWRTWDTAHLLGTDQLGRDLLARVAVGSRTSLAIGFAVTLITLTLGTILGLLAGIQGGWIDRLTGFLVDVQMAIPVIVLAIAMAALFEPGIPVVLLVVSSAGWVAYQRVVRVRDRVSQFQPPASFLKRLARIAAQHA
jgi:peptide/nickel transport system permease protein